ncbi:MAG: GDP-mannose 4,6-dehydratase, partial [Candidatus Aenigmatarchaeota archaeon]
GVEAFWLAATREVLSDTVINIGSGERVSINRLAEILKKISGKDFEINYASQRPGDIKHSQADIKRAQELLGFQPKWKLEEGLREVFQNRA